MLHDKFLQTLVALDNEHLLSPWACRLEWAEARWAVLVSWCGSPVCLAIVVCMTAVAWLQWQGWVSHGSHPQQVGPGMFTHCRLGCERETETETQRQRKIAGLGSTWHAVFSGAFSWPKTITRPARFKNCWKETQFLAGQRCECKAAPTWGHMCSLPSCSRASVEQLSSHLRW